MKIITFRYQQETSAVQLADTITGTQALQSPYGFIPHETILKKEENENWAHLMKIKEQKENSCIINGTWQ